MSSRPSAERSAARLTRAYPAAWRVRYGEEFTQMLVDELEDGPMPVTRRLDVVVHGLWSRLAYTGLAGTAVPRSRQISASLGALGGVLAAFLLLAAGIWSQLTVGWQWSAPANTVTSAAVGVMSAALIGIAGLVLALVCGTSALAIARVLRRGAPRGLVWALGAWFTAAAVLYIGCHHYAPHWPGSGGHPWSGRALVPAELARLSWAATLWLSAYWAHPAALGAFPAGEVLWMALSPLAWLGMALSSAAIVRRIHPAPLTQRWLLSAVRPALSLMLAFLAGAVAWLFSRDPGPANLFAVGAIDVVVVGALGAGLLTAGHLARRAGHPITRLHTP